MKKILQPKVLIPIILSIAIIVALLAFSDIKKVVGLMESFQKLYLLVFLALMIAYEIVRGVQWHYLLTAMGIHVPLRTQIFTFAAGEVTKSMPIGNYFQNYLLQQSKGTDFGRSSAATTLIVVTEVAVSLLAVVILGLGSWSDWLRPTIVIGIIVVFAAAALFRHFHQAGRGPKWMREHKLTRKALDELRELREGADELLHPRILIIETLLSATYLLCAGTALYFVVRGLGVTNASFGAVLGVYFFSLAFSLIFPIPVDIGVTEVSGVGAFLAVGVNRNAAVGAMLINRILSIGSAIAIALVALAILHDEFRAALHGRGRQQQGEAREDTNGTPDQDTGKDPDQERDQGKDPDQDQDKTVQAHS